MTMASNSLPLAAGPGEEVEAMMLI